jgi:hypothetical protein
MPPGSAAFLRCVLFLVLASLVGNAAAGLASGLAGSLALAAAAVLGALAQVTGLNGLNVFHGSTSIKKFLKIIAHLNHVVNTF